VTNLQSPGRKCVVVDEDEERGPEDGDLNGDFAVRNGGRGRFSVCRTCTGCRIALGTRPQAITETGIYALANVAMDSRKHLVTVRLLRTSPIGGWPSDRL
jgi:hypothetical protein